jgi:AraC-like DNA-binding protein/quercetin dioxygenase-like cupin family protein
MRKYSAEDLIDNKENISIQKFSAQGHEQEHRHDFIEIVYIWEGSGIHLINGLPLDVQKGDVLFFNIADTHSYTPEEEMGIYNCLINPEFFGEELINSNNALDILTLTSFKDFDRQLLSILPKVTFVGKEMLELEEQLNSMYFEFKQKEDGYKEVLVGYMTILLIKLFRKFKKSRKDGLYEDVGRLTPDILSFIENNYNQKLSLKELARENCYTPSYFSHMFKECFGKTFTDYLQDRRIEKALELLKHSALSIEQIAFEVGYTDKKQFYKPFRERLGLTPGDYRKRIMKNATNNK